MELIEMLQKWAKEVNVRRFRQYVGLKGLSIWDKAMEEIDDESTARILVIWTSSRPVGSKGGHIPIRMQNPTETATCYIGIKYPSQKTLIEYVHLTPTTGKQPLHIWKPDIKQDNLTKTKIWNSVIRADKITR